MAKPTPMTPAEAWMQVMEVELELLRRGLVRRLITWRSKKGSFRPGREPHHKRWESYPAVSADQYDCGIGAGEMLNWLLMVRRRADEAYEKGQT